jgi:hypothetical protein
MPVTTTLITGNVWQHLTEACRKPGRRRAAISYVGVDAPTLLPLRRGDVLIVNASDSALRNHATSPEALAAYHAAGVRVFSSARLHAKLLVTTNQAVVGSANASANSTHCHEAVLITNDAAILADARAFIDGLDDCIQVDEDFLRHAEATWAKGRPSNLPGLGETPADPGFLPPRRFACTSPRANTTTRRTPRRGLSAGQVGSYDVPPDPPLPISSGGTVCAGTAGATAVATC